MSNKARVQIFGTQTTLRDSTYKYNYNTMKVKIKGYFYEMFFKDRDTKVYEKLSWKEIRCNKIP